MTTTTTTTTTTDTAEDLDRAFDELQRNDPDGAMDLWRRARAAGELDEALVEALLMLQDDGDALLDRMNAELEADRD